jgi:hypothetical protein
MELVRLLEERVRLDEVSRLESLDRVGNECLIALGVSWLGGFC